MIAFKLFYHQFLLLLLLCDSSYVCSWCFMADVHVLKFIVPVIVFVLAFGVGRILIENASCIPPGTFW